MKLNFSERDYQLASFTFCAYTGVVSVHAIQAQSPQGTQVNVGQPTSTVTVVGLHTLLVAEGFQLGFAIVLIVTMVFSISFTSTT